MNSLANHITEQSTEQARQLHHDLLVSGLDRILIVGDVTSAALTQTDHAQGLHDVLPRSPPRASPLR